MHLAVVLYEVPKNAVVIDLMFKTRTVVSDYLVVENKAPKDPSEPKNAEIIQMLREMADKLELGA